VRPMVALRPSIGWNSPSLARVVVLPIGENRFVVPKLDVVRDRCNGIRSSPIREKLQAKLHYISGRFSTTWGDSSARPAGGTQIVRRYG